MNPRERDVARRVDLEHAGRDLVGDRMRLHPEKTGAIRQSAKRLMA